MFTNKKLVLICDFTRTVDMETGDTKKSVVNATRIMGSVELVGIQTQQLAQVQNMTFQYSIVIDRMFYKQQKYLYLENQLYEIKNVSAARLPQDCKLNVVVLQDKDIIEAIKEFENANLL